MQAKLGGRGDISRRVYTPITFLFDDIPVGAGPGPSVPASLEKIHDAILRPNYGGDPAVISPNNFILEV